MILLHSRHDTDGLLNHVRLTDFAYYITVKLICHGEKDCKCTYNGTVIMLRLTLGVMFPRGRIADA